MIKVRLAGVEEALNVLNEPRNQASIGKKSEALIYQPWCATDGRERLIFFFWPVAEYEYEVHVASPKEERLKARELAKEVEKWLFAIGAEKLITNAPEGPIANFVRKLGWEAREVKNRTVVFEKWCPSSAYRKTPAHRYTPGWEEGTLSGTST